MQSHLYDSIIPCFGSRFAVLTLPSAKQYRVHPLGTFHYFDWQKTDQVGISIGTCPQIVTSETALIGLTVAGKTRILPFAEGEQFAKVSQSITPLTTCIVASDPQLGCTVTITFRSLFYPKDMAFSAAPAYRVDMEISGCDGVEVEAFFGLPLMNATPIADGFRSNEPIVFPDGIDHTGIDGLQFEQVIRSNGSSQQVRDGYALVSKKVLLNDGEDTVISFVHAGYIAQPTLNIRGDVRPFGYTAIWQNANEVAQWMDDKAAKIDANSHFFESTINDATLPQALKLLMATSFKGIAANAWWATDWFSIMEIGAYHSTLDVDFQLNLFFFQYWPELIRPMLDQWADYYIPGSGYMAHDVGQHLEALGNRYGGPGSAMKVEENCNFILLLWHYWRCTADSDVVTTHFALVRELMDFLIASDTTGSGLPNQYCDNTNDWGSGLITASEEQSYHGVRMVMAYSAAAQMAEHANQPETAALASNKAEQLTATLNAGWLGDHYPISLSSPDSFQHYSMWTAHGLLYPLRSGLETTLDLEKSKIDLISSTARTLREHGSAHSSADFRGWQTQNLWRDCVAAYLGVDHSHLLPRYVGHGEYVSYEDTTILEVANELMVVPGSVAEHQHAAQTHAAPMIDGHPRPACAFGLPYALAGLQYDAVAGTLSASPVSFPLRIPLTHLADWDRKTVPWLNCTRSIPNQDGGFKAEVISAELSNDSAASTQDILRSS